MVKKYFKTFFIFIFSMVFLFFFIQYYFIHIYLAVIKKIHQYSLMYKNNTEIYKLIANYQIYKKKYYEIKFLEKELNVYKNKINNGNTFYKNTLLTEIIGYINNKKEKFIIINRGKIDNIVKNMVLIDNKNCILGKIVEIYDYYSKVLLIDNKDQYISVVFENNIEAILQGNCDEKEKTMKVIHIYNNQNKEIKKDDIVFSSGKGLLFPAGYVIGSIIENDTSNYLNQKIIIQNDYDLSDNNYCYIIIPTDFKRYLTFFLENLSLWDPLYTIKKQNNNSN